MSLDGALLVVGAGKMGGAMLSAWLEEGVLAPEAVFVEDPSPPADIQDLLAKYEIEALPEVQLSKPPALVLLAVKPQIMDGVLGSVAPRVDQNTLIVSIAAGQTLADLEKGLPFGTPIIRAMPNTPVMVQAGMTVMVANSNVTDAHKQSIEQLGRVMGEIAWLDEESLMDAVTAVSGSGPAYVFHLAECLAKAGEAEGLSPELATLLARQTIFGAGQLLHSSDLEAQKLRENVTSKGGTTAAALEVLMGSDALSQLFKRAVTAASKRSKELSG